jgi:hypothetical protein
MHLLSRLFSSSRTYPACCPVRPGYLTDLKFDKHREQDETTHGEQKANLLQSPSTSPNRHAPEIRRLALPR